MAIMGLMLTITTLNVIQRDHALTNLVVSPHKCPGFDMFLGLKSH